MFHAWLPSAGKMHAAHDVKFSAHRRATNSPLGTRGPHPHPGHLLRQNRKHTDKTKGTVPSDSSCNDPDPRSCTTEDIMLATGSRSDAPHEVLLAVCRHRLVST